MIIQLLGFQQTQTIMTSYILIIKVYLYIKWFLFLERETFIMLNNSHFIDISQFKFVEQKHSKEESIQICVIPNMWRFLVPFWPHLPDQGQAKSNFHSRAGSVPKHHHGISWGQRGWGALYVSGKWYPKDSTSASHMQASCLGISRGGKYITCAN